MKLSIYLFTYLLVSSMSQEKKVVHVFFDEASDKLYTYREGNQNYTLKYYIKYKRKHKYEFSIKGESFSAKRENIVDTCDISVLDKIKLSTIDDLKKESYNNRWTFKSNIYDTIYLYEKMNQHKVIKYKVHWMYIEY